MKKYRAVRVNVLPFLLCVVALCVSCSTIETGAPHAGPEASDLISTEKSFVSVVRDVSPSVVSIVAEMRGGLKFSPDGKVIDEKDLQRFVEDLLKNKTSPGKRQGVREGSGLIISGDGHVLTNNHVIAGATKVTVRLYDSRVFDGKIVGADARTDLAVVRIEASGLKVPKLGDSDRIEPGEWAIAIGSPYGFEKSVTIGVISAKGRSGFRTTLLGDLIQTDAAINVGNSGGPLVNIKGEVIGINSIVMRPGQGISFAIPINLVKRVTKDLIEYGKVMLPWVGMGLQDLDPEMKRYFALQDGGALVRQVVEEGPADIAGLKEGDIIVGIEGKKVDNTQTVINEMFQKKIGEKLHLRVVRDREPINMVITTGDEEAYKKAEPIPSPGRAGWFGLSVRTITPGIAQKIRRPDIEGVIITEVDPGSPAYYASLMADDVILLVDGKRIRDENDYETAVKEAPPVKGVMLKIDRGGSTFFVLLK